MRGRRLSALILLSVLGLIALTGPAAAQYHTLTGIGNDLLTAQTNYPGICQRNQIGVSGQGRPIWAVVISDNVGVEEDEPEFRYISTMHGDEIMGVEMCMNLVDYLTSNYGVDSRITDIVDSVEIWIVPLMNPDGFVAVTRGNAQGVDLNRDFPDPYTSPSNTTAGREAETAAIMNWTFGRSFTLAANLHGGSLVVNYPFDNNPSGSSVYTVSPDDDMFIWISEEYSRTNGPMWNSPSFFHGITNGADWYAISGGMQDWGYHYMGVNEVTIEISNQKMPPALQIPTFWNDNRESMLSYMETSLIGVRGIVTDAVTGDPLAAAVRVAGRDHDVFTDPDVGDYHRMLLPGTYDLTVEASGYDPLTLSDVPVVAGPATRADAALWKTTVIHPNGGEALNEGTASVVSWSGNPSARFEVQYTANDGELAATFEGFEGGVLSGEYDTGGSAPWGVLGGVTHSGSFAARSGAISDNQSTWMTRDVSGGDLSFWYRVSSESGYDFFNFYVDGNRLIHVSGTVGWTQFMTTLAGGGHELKWEYAKDGSVSNGSDAAWIDDVQGTTDNTTWTTIVSLTDPGATSTSWSPVTAGANHLVRVRSHYDDGTVGAWDESDATFMVEDHPIPAASAWGLLVLALAFASVTSVLLGRGIKVAMPRRATRALVIGFGLLYCLAAPVALAKERATIYSAAAAGDLEGLAQWLDQNPALADARDAAGNLPIHLAARNLRTQAVDLLLSAGADVNAKDRDGLTAMHIVLRQGTDSKTDKAARNALIELLLARDAKLDAVDEFGKTPLHIAAMVGRVDSLGRLIAAGAKIGATDRLRRTPLHDAALYGRAPVIDRLVVENADITAKDARGDTALHLAASRGQLDAVDKLLELGAPVNARNESKQTPLHELGMSAREGPEVESRLIDVADRLVRAGADARSVDDKEQTPADVAREHKLERLASWLTSQAHE